MVDTVLKAMSTKYADDEFHYGYDEFQNRYVAAITEGCNKGAWIDVVITFDDSNKLSEIKVSKQVTWW